jgi:hypothetical protein
MCSLENVFSRHGLHSTGTGTSKPCAAEAHTEEQTALRAEEEETQDWGLPVQLRFDVIRES